MGLKKDPAEDLPPLSVQDTGLKHTGALCPADGTLVTCGGNRADEWLVGGCPFCGRGVYARADLAHSTGSFEPPPSPPPKAKPADVKACTECLSDIPKDAKRCKFCGQPQAVEAPDAPAPVEPQGAKPWQTATT
jgi:hypothetical protein